MTFQTLISTTELQHAIDNAAPGALLLLDCSFALTDLRAGQRAYDAGHLPGARYVHLEDTLSTLKTGTNGRHPLPTPEAFRAALAALGANDDTQVVAYDNAGGMYAARLWWMARWIGHANAAVLDGGIAAWQAAGLPLTTEVPAAAVPGTLTMRPELVSTVSYEQLVANLDSGEKLVVDARAPDRFRGENETLDAVGGHIPGARNRLFHHNLDADGKFKTAAQLREELQAVLDGRHPSEIVNQCGSGVTACHNLLAMEIAGLSGAALYPGSWSEWSAQPGAHIATGE